VVGGLALGWHTAARGEDQDESGRPGHGTAQLSMRESPAIFASVERLARAGARK
jgi:hypothetical protein